MKHHRSVSTDFVTLEQAGTLGGLFRERARRSPKATAYVQFDTSRQRWEKTTWTQMVTMCGRWQAALSADGFAAGDRVAIMLRNCREWILFDQAANGLGLITVPLYTNDRAENIGFLLRDSGAQLLLLETEEQWQMLASIREQLAQLKRIVILNPIGSDSATDNLRRVDDWVPQGVHEFAVGDARPASLASIVYTSGTTGRAKGVMLSHHNILWNCARSLEHLAIYPNDLMLSFLPLSHALERTAGYYVSMMAGSQIAFARSIPQLADDLAAIRPSVLIAVPRIFERVYFRIEQKLAQEPALARRLFHFAVQLGWRRFEHRQGRGTRSPLFFLWPLLDRLVASKVRNRLGGRLRIAISGGAALSPEIARVFIGLGVPLIQGYGLTEASPVVSGNALDDNIPESIGIPIPGVETKIGSHNELLTRSPSVMLGYWNDAEATRRVIDSDGWLHTGDQVRRSGKHLFITGRLKEIIVLANGEKVPPADMEMAIALDGLFEQVMIVGEGKPYLAALVVLNPDHYCVLAKDLGLNPADKGSLHDDRLKQALVARVGKQLSGFPGYAQVYAVTALEQPWSVDNGMLTPTMKLRRNRIFDRYHEECEALYTGH